MRPTHDQSADSHRPVESSHSHHPTAVDETHATDTPDHADHRVHGGHDKHAGHSVAMFRDKFWLSLLLTIPTLVWGHMLQRAFGYHAPMFSGEPVDSRRSFGTAVFVYGGWPFLQGAWREIGDRLPGMMTLIALAITVAFVFSAAVTLGYPGHAALGGAGDARDDHAARPLARDALDLPGAGRARRAGQAAAECGHSRRRRRSARSSSRTYPLARFGKAMSCSFVLGRASRPMASCVAGESAVNESVLTGESRPVREEAGRQGHRRARRTARGRCACEVTGHRRPHRARRHHATGRAGAELSIARAGARGPSCILAHLASRSVPGRSHSSRGSSPARPRPTRSSDSSRCS